MQKEYLFDIKVMRITNIKNINTLMNNKITTDWQKHLTRFHFIHKFAIFHLKEKIEFVTVEIL